MAISESAVSEMRLAQSMTFVSNLFGFEIVMWRRQLGSLRTLFSDLWPDAGIYPFYRFRPYGGLLLANAPKVSKRSCPLHPGLAALDFPRSIIAPGARREGPSLAHRGSRGIHAAQPLTQRFHSAS